MKIKLTKTNVAENATFPTATDNSKQACELGDESPWVDYSVEGEIDQLPELDKSFSFCRTKRNGIEVFGYYSTSPIQSIKKINDKEYNLETLNSIYKLELL
jgi:hypothetical protein